VNDAQISTAISVATTRSNVVSVSVGNEPSLTGSALLMSCMEGYIKRVKQYVPQPITADDDFYLYAGNRVFYYAGVGYSAASFLPWLDFLSVHTYPPTNYNTWSWSTKRADANTLMTAAATEAQANFAAVKNYSFKNAAGVTTTIAAAMPIIIGETGWKAKQTNFGNPLETAAAKPQNAKWYFDLMNAWQADGTGPKTIFYFSSFDETWKGTDDGWGLWDKDRNPRYALCGTAVPNAPACTTPAHLGAGY
jgi:exo-beta-1,3-glucanase (GH17 family)